MTNSGKMVILFLGVALLACIISIAILAALSTIVPTILELVTTGILGALSGILARVDEVVSDVKVEPKHAAE